MLASLGQAMELAPVNPKLQFYRGLTYAMIDEVEAAKADLELALEIGVPPDLE